MSGGGGGGGSTRTSVDYPSWWSQEYLPTVTGLGDTFQGQAAQGLDPTSQQALDAIRERATAGSALTGPSMDFVQQLISGGGLTPEQRQVAQDLTGGGYVNPAMAETQRIAMGGDVGSNPHLDATFNRAAGQITDRFNDITAPELALGAHGAGAGGSGLYAAARGKEAESSKQGLVDLGASIYGGAYENDQQRRMGALGQLGALGQQGVNNAVTGAGLYSQGTAQAAQGVGLGAGLDATAYNDLERLYGVGQTERQAETQPMLNYLDVLNSLPGLGSGIRQTGGGGSAGMDLFAGALGLGSLGVAAAPLFMSDERAKEDIDRVGETDDGLPVYTYRYKGDPSGLVYMGVMAQEALKTQPEAVGVLPSGMLAVDYGAIT